jgi:hypothetical protein
VTRRQLVVAAVVWAAFAAFAAWRSPVPGINEPHYLCKARHFSDPAWCAGDMFLASANAHWVFYSLFGPLTRVLSFEHTAWCGRILVWGLLAFGWVRLVNRIAPGSCIPFWSAAIFLALQGTGNLSGEWLIGDVEAKGFAYAALLLAIAAAGSGAWVEAGIEAGVAISFHPVVGAWGAAALAAAQLAAWFTGRRRGASAQAATSDDKISDGLRSPSCGRGLLAAGLCLLFSLPGLIPAVALLADRPSAEKARIADEIQVFYRLKHHLDPAQFSTTACVAYAGLFVVWLIMRRLIERSAAEKFFTQFVMATVLIAGGGLTAGFWLRSPGLMKFYPFRLVDLFLPISASIAAAALLERLIAKIASGRSSAATALVHGFACAALAWALVAPGRVKNPSHWPDETWADFIEVCAWIDQNAPPDAVFLTPKYNVGFKWYARRAEYVTWKDCPQEAAGVLEWGRRINRLTRWMPRRSRSGMSDASLAEIARETDVSYILAIGSPPRQTETVYLNRTFSVALIPRARE